MSGRLHYQSTTMFFPEEVFRNICTFLIDPYKKDKEEHAKVWQRIRVNRRRATSMNVEDDYSHTINEQHDRYFVRTIPYWGIGSEIDTVFHIDDHTRRLENVFEFIHYSHASGDSDYDNDSEVEHEMVDDY